MLCVIDIHSKFLWVIPLQDKNGIKITFQKILDKSNCREAKSKGHKANKRSVEKRGDIYNRSMKCWVDKKAHRNKFNA